MTNDGHGVIWRAFQTFKSERPAALRSQKPGADEKRDVLRRTQIDNTDFNSNSICGAGTENRKKPTARCGEDVDVIYTHHRHRFFFSLSLSFPPLPTTRVVVRLLPWIHLRLECPAPPETKPRGSHFWRHSNLPLHLLSSSYSPSDAPVKSYLSVCTVYVKDTQWTLLATCKVTCLCTRHF